MDSYSIVKAVSLIATGVFGVIGILTNFRDSDGRVKKGGKIAIVGIVLSSTLSLALFGFEIVKATDAVKRAKVQYEQTQKKLDESLHESQALEGRLTSTADSLQKIDAQSREMAQKQKAMLSAGERLRTWQLRSSFPLTPLDVEIEALYPLNQPNLKDYEERIKLLPEVGASNDLKPRTSDGLALSTLSANHMTFLVVDRKRQKVAFHFTCENDDDTTPREFVSVVQDHKRFIKKTVHCGIVKIHRTPLYFSAIDLIGNQLIWQEKSVKIGWAGENLLGQWRLSRVTFRFPYNPNNKEIIEIPAGASSLILAAKHFDLDEKSADLLHYPPY